jgi:hypothetical protein
MMPRWVYLISVNRSRWPTHCIAVTMKTIVKLMKVGRTAAIAVPSTAAAIRLTLSASKSPRQDPAVVTAEGGPHLSE